MDEHDVLRIWRNLFPNENISSEALAEAESLLDGLSGESPLHLRLANELAELKRPPASRNKPQRRRKAPG